RLERRQAEVDAQARQIDETSARLAKQAEELQEQEREVVGRRNEMEHHLADMREWYRRKLRELVESRDRGVRDQESGVRNQESGVRDQEKNNEGVDRTELSSGSEAGGAPIPAWGRDILSLTGEVAPGDRQLGDLLQSLELVEADTLTALLVDARRQRRTLRQVLLASGYLTLYQLALIEAGNLDALVL